MSDRRERINNLLNSKTGQIIASSLVALGTGANSLSQSKYRDVMPDFIGEHVGNFGLSALPIVIAGITTKLIQERGRVSNNKKMETFGKNLYTWSIIFMLGVNTGVEGQFLNQLSLGRLKENIGYFSMGILAITLAAIAVHRFRNQNFFPTN